MSKADLSGTKIGWALLVRTNLSEANLSKADLGGAILSGTNLSLANLSGANLSESNLSKSDLSGANLSGANLNGTNLSPSNLNGVIIDHADWISRLKGWKCTGVEDIERKYEVVNEGNDVGPVYRIRERSYLGSHSDIGI